MSELKDQLIKIGESNPDLRPHLRPILDKVASRKVEAATSKFTLKGTSSFLKMEGMDALEKALQGLCTIENLELSLIHI